MIKNVIFDVGNVLVNFRPLEIMGDLHFPDQVIKELNERLVMSPLWDELDRSQVPMKEIFDKMIDSALEYRDYAKKFFDRANDMCISYDYAADWVKSFKDRGYNTYVLSNYAKELWTIHENNGVFTFLPYIDGMVVSGFVQKIKPDKAIYELLLNKYNLNPKECVFFDDRQVNIDAANELGINGILFTNTEEVERKFSQVIK